MLTQTKFNQSWQLGIAVLLALIGVVAGVGERTIAQSQIVPDKTLGTESSVVTPNVEINSLPSDRIDGGATRGANLFHSFQEFNVGQGRGAYFANPTGIENILTRVTGSNASNILGRLGVLGGANLFLLNPNGIVFGPNASLDIQGSFVATTAERIQLGDSGYFSAAQPQTSSLLSVSPGALFFNAVANQPGSIINQGNLSTGKHLTLAAGNLDLQGELLSGEDLTLQAQDTVKVRDTIASPIIATSGRNLTIQGNQNVDILALFHPLSKIQSGGNLNLVSNGNISGDAHFFSGGNLSMLTLAGTPGNFVSMFDPIIQANGDVLFGNYTGVALKVEATGSIQGGNIKVTGAECAAGFAGCVGGIPTTDPDFATLTGRSSVILRAGLASVNTPNLPQNAGGTGFTGTSGLPLGINVGNIDTSSGNGGNGGDIILSAAKGSITAGNLDSSLFSFSSNGGQGGAIDLTAANDININGNLVSVSVSSTGNAGQGGAITLTAANDINITGNLASVSTSSTGNAGQGGAIDLTAANGSITTGTLDSVSTSSTGNAGQGGAIGLTAANDININGSLGSVSRSNSGNAGQGGAIGLTAANNINITGDLDSYSSSNVSAGQGGEIRLTVANDINITGALNSSSSGGGGNGGQGGNIILNAANGSINTGALNSSSSGYSGNGGQGGNIILNAANGSINTGDLHSYASEYVSNAGQGGDIILNAANGINITGTLDSYSRSRGNVENGGNIILTTANGINITGALDSSSQSNSNAGQGGNIILNAANGINITGALDSSSGSGRRNAENGGNIILNAANGSINTGNLDSSSVSYNFGDFGNAGQGGTISLTAANGSITTGNLYSFSYSLLGTAGQGGAISLIARGGDISGLGNQSTVLGSFSISEKGTAGNGGNVALEAKNNVSNLEILTLSSDSKSGTVQVRGLGDLLLKNTNILTSKQVTVPDPLYPGEFITLTVGGKGQSGNVDVTSSGNLTFNNSSIQSDTKGSDNAGNVTVSSPSLVTFNNSFIRSNTSSTGAAGSIDIKAGQGITLVGMDDFSPVLSVETSSAGQPGNIIINSPSLTLSNTARITATATNTATNPQGGGSITLNASIMDLAGVVGVFAETQGQTPAGTLTLKPYENQSTLNLTLAPQSLVSASTSGSGKGGNLIVQAPEAISIRGKGQLAVQTTGDGAAGNLTIDTQRLTVSDGATVSASTFSLNPNGVGGNITVNAAQSLDLSNGASLLAQSNGAAPAGNITINTANLTARDANIATSSEQSSGGDINITADKIRLYGNSDITTNVGSGTGGGGNITLTADSIIAFDDSDILTFASGGKGGDIAFISPAFFGQNYKPAPTDTDPRTLDGNNRVDINASGAVSGVITLPDTSLIQNSLSELPQNLIDTSNLIANSCIPRSSRQQQGSFTITGSGGLPTRPGDALMSLYTFGNVRSVSNAATSTNSNHRPWHKGDPIVEPQGVYRLSSGQLVLSRECP